MLDFLYFTSPILVLFWLFIICMLTILAILDLKKRSRPRKGFLPYPTTRGDRVFHSIICIVGIGLLWLRFVPLPIEYALILAIPLAVLILIKG